MLRKTAAQANASLIRASARLIETTAAREEQHYKQMEEQHRHFWGSMMEKEKQVYALTFDAKITENLRQNGVLPFVNDPASQVNQHLQVIMDRMGLDLEGARSYVRSNLGIPESAPRGD